MARLKAHPKLGRIAEPVRQAKGGIARDGALAVDDLGDAVGGDVKLAGQLGRRHTQRFEFLGKHGAGVRGRRCHSSAWLLASASHAPHEA